MKHLTVGIPPFVRVILTARMCIAAEDSLTLGLIRFLSSVPVSSRYYNPS